LLLKIPKNVKLQRSFSVLKRSASWGEAALFILVLLSLNSNAQKNNSLSQPSGHRSLEAAMEEAWRTSWSLFYHPDTQLFYDYVTSYYPGKSLAHLPVKKEVTRQFPNSYGYDTGMEDCGISAGVMLVMVTDRYATTGEVMLSTRAKAIFQGIQRIATVHGSPGFVARGVCVDDAQSVYPSTSRDQVTHVVHGLWYYYNSPLADDETKNEVRETLGAIADRMKQNVQAENNYDFLRPDGTCEPIGLQRMWEVGGHEAARLPMIYAAAWNVTENDEYYRLYRKYVYEAVKQSSISLSHVSTWGLLQMQISFEVLGALEEDPSLRSTMDGIIQDIATECRRRAEKAWYDGGTLNLTALAKDWRMPDGGIKSNGQYRKIWYCIRQSGEAALAQIIAGPSQFTNDQRDMLEGAIQRLNYSRVSSNGIYYLQAAYWKGRRMKIY
jgi:hypothetical protein